MQLNDAIKNRKSVKRFSSRKPDWRDIIECVESARYIPLAGGIPTLKFILVSDKEKIAMIAEASQQDFISQAHYVIAVVSNPNLTIKSYGKSGEKYSTQQAGAAIQNFLLSIEEKGLGSCWVGYFNEKQIKRELKIPDNAVLEAILPVGYELKKEKPSRKPNFDSMLYFNKYGEKKMKRVKTVE